jgi:hypothetical protein
VIAIPIKVMETKTLKSLSAREIETTKTSEVAQEAIKLTMKRQKTQKLVKKLDIQSLNNRLSQSHTQSQPNIKMIMDTCKYNRKGDIAKIALKILLKKVLREPKKNGSMVSKHSQIDTLKLKISFSDEEYRK